MAMRSRVIEAEAREKRIGMMRSLKWRIEWGMRIEVMKIWKLKNKADESKPSAAIYNQEQERIEIEINIIVFEGIESKKVLIFF